MKGELMRRISILAVCFLLFVSLRASAAGDPRKTMAGSCGCSLWHIDEKHADRTPPLFFLRSDERDGWLRIPEGKRLSGPIHMMLNAQFDKRWWQGEPAHAMYITESSGFSVGLHLRPEVDCPPDAAAACRSFPVEGTMTITRPKRHENLKVAGRCGC